MIPKLTYTEFPLVSVIIPCYNHAMYLSKAFESIFLQNYPNIEVIVIDDGSTDNTRDVVLSTPGVNYFFQQNSGLSAARNTGIKQSKGEYLVFLDADDWFYPNAIHTNASYLQQNPNIAFISGDYDYTDNEKVIVHSGYESVTENHYLHLLNKNYIGMIAAVMFRRCVFDEFLYDESLKNCEDYDLYLNISRKYPVMHHPAKMAVYRFHSSNMSGNIPAMLKGVLKVLKKQKYFLKNADEKRAYLKGIMFAKEYYCKVIYEGLISNNIKANKRYIITLLKFDPSRLAKFIFRKIKYYV